MKLAASAWISTDVKRWNCSRGRLRPTMKRQSCCPGANRSDAKGSLNTAIQPCGFLALAQSRPHQCRGLVQRRDADVEGVFVEQHLHLGGLHRRCAGQRKLRLEAVEDRGPLPGRMRQRAVELEVFAGCRPTAVTVSSTAVRALLMGLNAAMHKGSSSAAIHATFIGYPRKKRGLCSGFEPTSRPCDRCHLATSAPLNRAVTDSESGARA